MWANDRAIPKVNGESAFGGSHGALRGVVCFIPKNTAHIRDVQSCDPVTSFYTNELNVPVILYAISAGPLKTESARRALRTALNVSPPPVITVKPASAKRRPTSRART